MKWICARTVCELHFRAVKRNDQHTPPHPTPPLAAFIHVPVPSALLFPLNHHSLSSSLGGPGHHSVKLNHKSFWAEETVRLRMNEWLGSVVWCLLMNGQCSKDIRSRVFMTDSEFAVILVWNGIFQKSELPLALALIWRKSEPIPPQTILPLPYFWVFHCFSQSYLPLFTPALFGTSFLHLLWVGLCPLTSLLACFPWLSTAVALSAKPLFSSTLLYKLAGCLSQAPALLMRTDVSGRCLSPGQRTGSPSSFDLGHSTSTWILAFLCARLLARSRSSDACSLN